MLSLTLYGTAACPASRKIKLLNRTQSLKRKKGNDCLATAEARETLIVQSIFRSVTWEVQNRGTRFFIRRVLILRVKGRTSNFCVKH